MEQKRFTEISADAFAREHAFNGIDLVKFICALLIFVIHVHPFQTDLLGLEFLNPWIRDCLCRFAVPFYFVSSGFLLFRKAENRCVDADRMKGFVFKNLRLAGTWFFLLIVGGKTHLWFLGALVLAALIVNFLFKKEIKLRFIGILAFLLYAVGMLGTSYHRLIDPLLSNRIMNVLITWYVYFFRNTRNGVFFGFIYVFMGALFAQKRIVLRKRTALLGFILSYAMLLLEVFFLHRSDPMPNHDNDMFVFLVPVVFFLFYLATHVRLKNRPIYKRMRAIGLLIYFLHLFVDQCVVFALEIMLQRTGKDLSFCHFTLSLSLTVLLAVVIERLSGTQKLYWLKYLYT